MLPCTCFARIPLFFCHTALPLSPSIIQRKGWGKKSHTRIFLREQLREQHELTQEIGNAITSMPITEPIDEDELQADLDKLEQEALDEKMLRTGTVPVADSLSNRLPAGPTGASTSLLFLPLFFSFFFFLTCSPPVFPNKWPCDIRSSLSASTFLSGTCCARAGSIVGNRRSYYLLDTNHNTLLTPPIYFFTKNK